MLKNNCDIVDYYRNKLTLNMAGTLLMWHTDTAAVLENLLMCDLLIHAQTFGTLLILKPVLKKWDIEFLKELYQNKPQKYRFGSGKAV